MLAWLGGIALQLQQATLWPSAANAACIAAGVLAAAAVLRRRHDRVSHWVLCTAIATTAFGVTAWRADVRLAERLSPALEGRDLLVTGVVDRMPLLASDGYRFAFAVEGGQADGRAVALPPLLALSWSRGDEGVLAAPTFDLRAGQRWQFPLRLRRPHAALNPQGFDGELWLFEQGFGATGTVRSTVAGPQPRLLADTGSRPIERSRQSVRDALLLRVSDARVAGVLAALAVGDQAAIARSDWDLFRDAGVAHLMSISGLHVTMFAWLAGALVAWLWRRSPRACLRLPAPQAGRLGGLAVAALYALVAGFGVPAQRTLLMLAAAVALRASGTRCPWPLVLLAAAVAVTVFDPWALLQAGFWLSFAAVGLLMAGDPLQREESAPTGALGWLRAALRTQAIATLGLAPLSLIFFQQVSLVGFVANLVAIPWVTLIVTPLALTGVLLPWLWALAAGAMAALVWLLEALTAWPSAVWTVAAAPAWAAAAGIAAALLGLLPLPWRLRLLALPLALPLLWPAVAPPSEGRFDLVVLDVGQGTAVLVRTRSRLLVYDTGPAYSREADAGQRIVVPLLRARGERQVDLLMLSHRDSDHVGGAASLRSALPVVRWSTSLAAEHPLLAGAVDHRRCDAGQHWAWDGVDFEVLHPTAAEHAGATKPNAVSCVLRVADSAGRSVLLTGDIESPQEAALVARSGPALRSTLLLVPHHGSKTSSTDAFLDAVRPQIAVVQAGYRSRFGHPAPEVLARYEAHGIMLVRSDRCGAWSWSDGAFQCARDTRRRYWHWTDTALGAEVASPGDAGERRP